MSHMKGGFDWIRSHYPVPAKPGMRIEFDGQPGRITSVAGGHLVLHFDGEPARRRHRAHPCWRIKYFGSDGRLLCDTTEVTRSASERLSAPSVVGLVGDGVRIAPRDTETGGECGQG